MTLEEYRAALADVLSDPATAAAKSETLLTSIGEDLADAQKAKDDVAALTGNYTALQGRYNQLVIAGSAGGNRMGSANDMEKEPEWGDVMANMVKEIAGEEAYYGPAV